MIAPEYIRFARSFPDGLLLVSGAGEVLFANARAADLLHQSAAALAGCTLEQLASGPPESLRQFLERAARTAQPLPGKLTLRVGEQHLVCRCEGWLLQQATAESPAVVCIRTQPDLPAHTAFKTLTHHVEELAREAAARKRADALLNGQKRVLELLVQDVPLSQVLDLLVTVVEQLSPNGLLTSILLLDRDGQHLRHGAAPTLPAEYNQAIDGVEIGPRVGSCGTACYRREPVIVPDIRSSPLWEDFRELADKFGLRACWSTPIKSSQGNVLGTFAMYYREPGQPTSWDWQMIEVVTRTAAIAIEKARSEEARASSEETLRKAEKLAAAGRLAATIAHEINNPLEAVTNLLFIVRGSEHLPDELKQYLDTAEYELSRVAHIARQTLGFYRESARVAWAEPAKLLDEILLLYRSKLESKRLTVTTDYRDVAIRCWPGEIRQVFANLVANAIDATPAGGKLSVSVHPGSDTDLTVSISDTGCGIRHELMPRLFEPFFTTKRDIGTGLGLWVAKEIVGKHQGSIEVESSTDPARSGTTFRVHLPVDCEARSTSRAA